MSKPTELMKLIGHSSRNHNFVHDSVTVDWEHVRQRLLSHPDEAKIPLQKYPLHDSLWIRKTPVPVSIVQDLLRANPAAFDESALYRACGNPNISADVVRVLLEYLEMSARGKIDPFEVVKRMKLLHFACMSKSVEAVRVIIEKFPGLVFIRGDASKFLPLNWALHKIEPEITILLMIGWIRYKGPYSSGGFYEGDNGVHVGPMPILTILERIRGAPNEEEYQQAWDCFEICLQIAEAARTNRIISYEGDEEYYPPLHAAIGHVPLRMYEEIIQRYDLDLNERDCDGRTALEKVIVNATPIQDTHQFEYGEWKSVFELFCGNTEGGRDQCAMQRDPRGRLPLHIAAERGLQWSNGLREILKANFSALTDQDPVSRLFPFMLAATEPSSDLDSVYSLLLQNPELVRDENSI